MTPPRDDAAGADGGRDGADEKIRPPKEPDGSGVPHSGRDPRLEIPEVLRERPGDAGGASSRNNPPESASSLGDLARGFGMATGFVFSIVGATALGFGVDWLAGTTPLWTLVGLVVGFIAAFIRIIRESMRLDREQQAARRGREQSDGGGK